MGKIVADAVLDGALNVLKTTANLMTACSNQPANRADAVTNMMLGNVAMNSADYTIADGTTNGRKVTMAQKSNVTVAANGTANHVALVDGSNLLYVTTATAQALTSGNTMTFNAWAIEIADPT
jgi:hypothetical protein